MHVGVLIMFLQLPGCGSLKEKRGRLKPLLNQLHKRYNVSVSEVDDQDIWGRAVIACVLVSNQNGRTQSMLQKAANWVVKDWRDVEVEDCRIEML
jgi:uncharacterized protein YlxP (DUF503 family)